MHPSYLIGIDVGTGSVKAVALSFDFQLLASVKKAYAIAGESNGQDAAAVFETFLQSLHELTTTCGASPVAVVLSAAMHSVLAVDANGLPLTKALLWSDTRSREVAAALRNTEEGRRLYEVTGTPLHAMSPLCKLAWLRENEPLLFAKAAKFISLKEYIWHRLFDAYAVDYGIASATGLFNVHRLQWEEEALRFAGIETAQLSVPVPPSHQQKLFNADCANATGIATGTPFFVGGSDGCLANLGSLCLNETTAALTIGTSAAVRITRAQPVVDAGRMIFNYRLDETRFVCGGATNNGGNVLHWAAQTFFGESDEPFAAMFDALPTVNAGSEGLLFLPYLHGERSPVWDESASGLFVGVKALHTRAHFARAAAEGLCFALKEILCALEGAAGAVKQVRLSGGGAQQPVLWQLLADVIGKELAVVRDDTDASALGAAYLGLKALGVVKEYNLIPARQATVLHPVAENVSLHQKQFSLYRQLYPAFKSLKPSSH